MIEFITYILAYCVVVFFGGFIVKSCIDRFKRRGYYWFGVYLLESIFLAAWLVMLVINVVGA